VLQSIFGSGFKFLALASGPRLGDSPALPLSMNQQTARHYVFNYFALAVGV
jgi:hypothetical protein